MILSLNKIKYILLFVMMFQVISCAADEPSEDPKSNVNSNFEVVTTIYPLGYLAQEILGVNGNITVLAKPGVDFHDYEITPGDLLTIYDSDLFILNGLGLDSGVEKVLNLSEFKNPSVLMHSISGDDVLSNTEHPLFTKGHGHGHHDEQDEHDEHEEDDEHDEHSENNQIDPHVWLDPVLALVQAQNIYETLRSLQPQNADELLENFEDLSSRLTSLESEYQSGLKSCEKDHILISHSFAGYLAMRYGMVEVPISGLSHSDNLSAKEISELLDEIKILGTKHILVEPLHSLAVIEVFVRDIGLTELTLQPLASLTEDAILNGDDYLSVSLANLGVLKEVLHCED